MMWSARDDTLTLHQRAIDAQTHDPRTTCVLEELAMLALPIDQGRSHEHDRSTARDGHELMADLLGGLPRDLALGAPLIWMWSSSLAIAQPYSGPLPVPRVARARAADRSRLNSGS
jgi:hypothetical protein